MGDASLEEKRAESTTWQICKFIIVFIIGDGIAVGSATLSGMVCGLGFSVP